MGTVKQITESQRLALIALAHVGREHNNKTSEFIHAMERVVGEKNFEGYCSDVVSVRDGAIVEDVDWMLDALGIAVVADVGEGEAANDYESWTAWMVERDHPQGGLQYLTMADGGSGWTDDPLVGMHFVRREDAERFASGREDAGRVAQHEFVDPPWMGQGPTHTGTRTPEGGGH